ncbi:MAG: HTTM domain-containing protein [Planctomycetales bacterium]|nr:HTTM domain-containing protein [Planctomycetales bacterium]
MISAAWAAARQWFVDAWRGWEEFWFKPSDPATLSLIRVLAGAMLVYTHLVWTIGLDRFLSADSMLSVDFVRHYHGTSWAWSYLYYVPAGVPLWIVHGLGLLVLIAFWVGFKTRVTGILAALITIAYVNRVPAALFGLDQINSFLAMYLAVGPSGAYYSVDRWLERRRTGIGKRGPLPVSATPGATVSIRLIQLHMCLVYLFAGVGKLQGESWWNGEAFWGAVANREYQTLDLTWLASYPFIIAALTHITVFWEVSYSALVWFRLTRPFIVVVSIPLHLGIAFGMGMITFGLIMIVGNMAFLAPSVVHSILGRFGLDEPAREA